MKSIKLVLDHYEAGKLIGRAGDLVDVSDEIYEYLQGQYLTVRQEAAPQVEQIMQLSALVKGKKK